MKKLVFIFLIFYIFVHSSLLAQDIKDKPIKVGIVELEFWGEQDLGTGTLTGIYPTIIRELYKRMHIETVQTLAPYPRIMNGLKSGKYDMTITLPNNDPSLIVGEKIWTIRLGVLSKHHNPVVTLEQLADLRVGVIRGAKFEPRFDEDSSIYKVESVQHENLLQMLEKDRIDAIASDLTILNGLIKERGKSQGDFAKQLVVNELSLHVILSSKSSYIHLNKKINKTISEMIEDGTIEKIVFEFIK